MPSTALGPLVWPNAGLDLQLAAVDWGFTQARRADPLESIHPYPAKFIPEIPGTLLDLLPVPQGTSILDPFVGSGTTLIEAQRRGFHSVGIDINPIACLISRVKTSPTPPSLADQATSIAYSRHDSLAKSDRGDIPNVDHWFKPDVQAALANLSAGISLAPPEQCDALRLALSAIVVRVSNQESDTRYAAVAKAVDGEDVAPLFVASAKRIEAALRKREWALLPAHVFEHDAQQLREEHLHRPIGAVITSPPYPNAYEYWLYHKYRMYWLEQDPLAVKSVEIGARPHFFKKNPHTPSHFFKQMTAVFASATTRLVPGGWMCVVVGRSRIAGRDVDNAEIIRNVAQKLELRFEAELVREISASRKSFNLSHARIKTESILVFRRP